MALGSTMTYLTWSPRIVFMKYSIVLEPMLASYLVHWKKHSTVTNRYTLDEGYAAEYSPMGKNAK